MLARGAVDRGGRGGARAPRGRRPARIAYCRSSRDPRAQSSKLISYLRPTGSTSRGGAGGVDDSASPHAPPQPAPTSQSRSRLMLPPPRASCQPPSFVRSCAAWSCVRRCATSLVRSASRAARFLVRWPAAAAAALEAFCAAFAFLPLLPTSPSVFLRPAAGAQRSRRRAPRPRTGGRARERSARTAAAGPCVPVRGRPSSVARRVAAQPRRGHCPALCGSQSASCSPPSLQALSIMVVGELVAHVAQTEGYGSGLATKLKMMIRASWLRRPALPRWARGLSAAADDEKARELQLMAYREVRRARRHRRELETRPCSGGGGSPTAPPTARTRRATRGARR